MKAKKTYLKGQSVFIVSLLVIFITALSVYWAGINYSRSLTANLYLSLGIIATALFLFMTYGLYKGIGLIDNFPEFKRYTRGDYIPQINGLPELPDIGVDGIGGIILSILLWIGMTILFIVLLIVLEAVFWFSLFIIMARACLKKSQVLQIQLDKVKTYAYTSN